MKIVFAGVALALPLILSADAGAYVFGGSNLGIMGYPDPTCMKPYDKPTKPFDLTDHFAVDQYNADVERYNEELDRYIRCIKEYLANADSDRQRISEKEDEVIAKAKSPY